MRMYQVAIAFITEGILVGCATGNALWGAVTFGGLVCLFIFAKITP